MAAVNPAQADPIMMTFSVAIDVLYEDDDLLAINKSSGILVIPGRWEKEGSLSEELNRRYGKIYVVHRLDRDTSGVVLFAKSADAHRKLSRAFEKREIRKIYYGLTHGRLKRDQGVISKPIAPCRDHPGKVIVDRRSGKLSETEIQVLERWGDYSWIEIHPLTGRTHQIRLHLASIGFPLVCDVAYGLLNDEIHLSHLKKRRYWPKVEAEKPLLSRLALHAARVEFIHPVSQEKLVIESPLPKDLKAVTTQFKKYFRE